MSAGRLPPGPATRVLAYLGTADVVYAALLGFGRTMVEPCLYSVTQGRRWLTVGAARDCSCPTLERALREWAAVRHIVGLFGGGALRPEKILQSWRPQEDRYRDS